MSKQAICNAERTKQSMRKQAEKQKAYPASLAQSVIGTRAGSALVRHRGQRGSGRGGELTQTSDQFPSRLLTLETSEPASVSLLFSPLPWPLPSSLVPWPSSSTSPSPPFGGGEEMSLSSASGSIGFSVLSQLPGPPSFLPPCDGP
jgi:hypothetical protein